MSAHRVVVVGHGMVGARFAEDLLAAVPPGGPADVRVTVLGAEPYPAYNRLLLSEVLAGRAELGGLELPPCPDTRLRLLTGVAAASLDRAARAVTDDHGHVHPYDTVVLATGADPRIPDVPGLDAGLPPGAHALRTVDDAREVLAASGNARRAVVVGGGLLGLEAACGLAGRGVDVTVVHGGDHLLDRQLPAEAGATLLDAGGDLGLVARTGRRPAEVVLGAAGGVAAVRLDDGEVVTTDLLVFAAGVAPRVALAVRAGLPVERGVVVGDDLRSPADAAVAAIGDCAQDPAGCTGLLGPGWSQAARLSADLAAGITGAPTEVLPVGALGDGAGPAPVRLKAALDVVTCGSTRGRGLRVVRVADPTARRYVELALAADGTRLAGVVCVGAGPVGTDLAGLVEHGGPVPADPLHLLLPAGSAPVSAPSPTLMPPGATVCRCNGVSKAGVVGAWDGGARDVTAVAGATRATTGCGSCRSAVCGLLEWLEASDGDGTSRPPSAGSERGVSRARRRARVSET